MTEQPNGDHLKTVADLIRERPNIDNTAVFDRLRGIQAALFARIAERFPLTLDPGTAPVRDYHSLDGNATGHMETYAAPGGDRPGLDWLVYSWVGNPALSFCNMHLTAWLGPETDVPHFAFAAGTFPVTFFLVDFIPRREPILNPDYVSRYFRPVNERFMKLHAEPRVKPFVSQDPFTREAVSQVGLNFIAQPGIAIDDMIEESAHDYLDRWLGWLAEADPVPAAERAALAARDLAVRRNSAEGDPANIVVQRMYGAALTERLVRALWGGDRTSARADA
jgi:hypothetical protein